MADITSKEVQRRLTDEQFEAIGWAADIAHARLNEATDPDLRELIKGRRDVFSTMLRQHREASLLSPSTSSAAALAILDRWEHNMDHPEEAGPLEIHHTDLHTLRAALQSPPTSSPTEEMVAVARVDADVRTVLNISIDNGLLTTGNGYRIYHRIMALLKSAKVEALTYAELTSFMHNDTVSITIPRSALPVLAQEVEREMQRLQGLSPLAHDMAFMVGTDEEDHPKRVAAWKTLSAALKGQKGESNG